MPFTYIEDLLTHIGNLPQEKKLLIPPSDRGILFSIIKQLSRSLALTEKQGDLVLRVIKNIDFLYSDPDMKLIVDYPKYRYPFRMIDKAKIIDIVEVSSTLIKNKRKVISLKYPFDLNISKSFSKTGIKKDFDTNSKLHLVDLTVDNLIKVCDIGKEHGFEINEKVSNLLKDIIQVKNNPYEYLPAIDYIDGKLVILNENKLLSDYFNKNANDDFLHDIFLTKILNLTMTDRTKSQLSLKNCDVLTKKIINSEINKNKFSITSSSPFGLFNLTAFFKDVKNYPVLVSIPDNENTITLLNQWLIALNVNGISNKEISFLFRSPKNKVLNDAIKEKAINNLIDDETKIVFINHKIPKTLYKLNFKSNILILNENTFGHYTLQKMIDSTPIVMYYCNTLQHAGNKIIDL